VTLSYPALLDVRTLLYICPVKVIHNPSGSCELTDKSAKLEKAEVGKSPENRKNQGLTSENRPAQKVV
jgi:hypothetical protein